MTFVDGIASAANKPVEAFKGIVEKIRNFLPFSPAKEGPLKDLDKIRLVETFAATIDPAPAVKAMDQVASAVARTVERSFPAINPRELGNDLARADPLIHKPTYEAPQVLREVREMRDSLTIKVEAENGTNAEVTQRPKRAKLDMRSSGGASGEW